MPGDSNYNLPGDSNYLVPGEAGYDDAISLEDNISQTYMDILMDFNMCSIDVIYKYNLSSAIRLTKEMVTSPNWATSIENSDE